MYEWGNNPEYYSRPWEITADINNYITGEAVVNGIHYDYEQERLSFWLTEIDDIYSGNTFIVEGKSVSIMKWLYDAYR